MAPLSRLVLVRHGETTGQSSIRYYGSTDVRLSALGREQMREARRQILIDTVESVWASSLARAWQAAQIVAPARPVRLEASFREIDFGRWEGLTREEIEVLDPPLFEHWQSGEPGFEFPEGEARGLFRDRVAEGLERLHASRTRSALVVAHKGVLRTLFELVTGQALPAELPELGGVVHLWRDSKGTWSSGRIGSDTTCSTPPVSNGTS